jgi:hypothetical protein
VLEAAVTVGTRNEINQVRKTLEKQGPIHASGPKISMDPVPFEG